MPTQPRLYCLGMASDAPMDPESVSFMDNSIDAMTEAYASVKMPAEIGLNQHRGLWCKVNNGADDNIMPLYIFYQALP